MSKPAWLVAGTLLVAIAGCGSEPDVGGEWDLTLTLSSDDGTGTLSGDVTKESYEGELTLKQTFDRFQGSGFVLGPGGPECRVQFLVEGTVLDRTMIPVKFDFSESSCPQDVLDADATMTLQLIDDGYVLYGHNTYAYENQRLYASASLRLYD